MMISHVKGHFETVTGVLTLDETVERSARGWQCSHRWRGDHHPRRPIGEGL